MKCQQNLAKTRFVKTQSQYEVGNEISEDAQNEIQHIMNKLTTGDTDPDKREEIQRIGAVCQKGKMNRLQTVKADLLVENDEGSLFLFDLKTVKPNKGDFEKLKKTLLDWCAIALAKTPDLDIHSLIAIPYNPYEPGPYKRWTAKGMLDLGQELKIADGFWDFLEPVLKSKKLSSSAVDLSIHSEPHRGVGVGVPNPLGLETKPLPLT